MKENNFINSDKIYLFHNNRCSKSREVKKYLDDNNIIYEVIDYINILPQESFLKGAISRTSKVDYSTYPPPCIRLLVFNLV